MNEFKTYHPIVNFIYFLLVIGCTMFFMHPVCLCVSLLCSFIYSVLLKGAKAIKTNLLYMLPLVAIAGLMNPAFNHQGITVLGFLPSGNPITAESVIYGIGAAVMIVSVICWFSCYNRVMTSDKFIYLFGRIIPALSLIISMTLRFVPKFSAQLKVVANAQRCAGKDISKGSIVRRAKHGLNILSIMTTWSLENAIETADSMKSRGYGIPGRTSYSIFTFDKRDAKALLWIIALGSYTLIGNLAGGMYFVYFPSVKFAELSIYNISIFFAYFLLCVYPILIEIREVRKWKSLKQKI